MYKPFVCTFFGHRDFDEHIKYENVLEKIITDILMENSYAVFLIGRSGEFDRFVSSLIRKVVKRCGFSIILKFLCCPMSHQSFPIMKTVFWLLYRCLSCSGNGTLQICNCKTKSIDVREQIW